MCMRFLPWWAVLWSQPSRSCRWRPAVWPPPLPWPWPAGWRYRWMPEEIRMGQGYNDRILVRDVWLIKWLEAIPKMPCRKWQILTALSVCYSSFSGKEKYSNLLIIQEERQQQLELRRGGGVQSSVFRGGVAILLKSSLCQLMPYHLVVLGRHQKYCWLKISLDSYQWCFISSMDNDGHLADIQI